MSISVIVPVYNESESIEVFLDRIIPVLKKIEVDYEIIFILDPSSDNTEEIILNCLKINPKIKLIKLSRRFGQQQHLLEYIMQN